MKNGMHNSQKPLHGQGRDAKGELGRCSGVRCLLIYDFCSRRHLTGCSQNILVRSDIIIRIGSASQL
eukprot:768793-Hanusia_phi.AAC.5